MGGHDGGDVASSLVAGALASFPAGKAASRGSILSSITAANELVFDHSGRGQKVMGTTLTGIAFTDEPSPSLVILNVGDSRTYLTDGTTLSQVTKDHSYVQELVDAGEIDEQQAAHHAERNVVTRALGIESHVDIDATTVAARAGQRWMMCSDGLSGEVDLADIERILAADDPQDVANDLIAAVLAGRGADNVSVIVVDVVAVEDLDDPDRTDPRPTRTVPAPPSTPIIEAAPTFPAARHEDHT
jgi:serine/threonine protein phosphatase PrpC